VSSTRYWLLVLLIPLFGVFLVGFTIGLVELALWVVLAVVWLVAFVRHERVKPWAPAAVLGAVVVLGAGVAVYNYATAEGSHATEGQRG
jgi:hypothetical protein